MADTAVETVLGIIETQGGTSSAKTLVPALIDLGQIIEGGGEIADGSVTTAKLADEAVTNAKIDPTVISELKGYTDSSVQSVSNAIVIAASAAERQVLASYGIAAEVMVPSDFDVSDEGLLALLNPRVRLCWLNGTDVEIAPPYIIGDGVNETLMMYAVGNTSIASGVLGVDSSWTITPNSSGGGSANPTFGTCNTSESTSTKDVVCSGFELTDGALITVSFTTGNTADSPKLNVNSTGSKAISVLGSDASSSYPLRWSADTLLTFCYNSLQQKWKLVDKPSTYNAATSGNPTYGYAWKVNTCPNFVVMNGTVIVMRALTAQGTETSMGITLAVQSTGAATVYKDNAPVSDANPLIWSVNDVLTFVRSSGTWQLASHNKAPTS